MLASPARCLVALALLGGLAVAPGAASAQEETEAAAELPTIYKWIDTNGISHYTTEYDSIPRRLRSSARRLGTSSGGEGYESSDAQAPRASTPERGRSGARGGRSEAERWAESDRPRTWEDDSGGTLWDDGDELRPEPDPRDETVLTRAERDRMRRDIDDRISELEADIAADEEMLKLYVAAPAPEDPAELAFDQTFRAVAERLPALLSELRSLEAERADLDRQ